MIKSSPNYAGIQVFACWISLTICTTLIAQQAASESSDFTRGESLYKKQCLDCHGAMGQGVDGAYDRPLAGDLAISQLAEVIDKTMPEGEPEACSGDDARAVAEYVYHQFYSELAQNRLNPPSPMLSRLTAEQIRQSIADLYASSNWIPRPEAKRGLSGEYFKSAKQRKEDRVAERTDAVINFDFGLDSPGAGIDPKEFAIVWNAGLRVDRSGIYEIIVRSTCSFTLGFGKHDRMLIDNHVQSGDKTEFREQVFLTAGRAYPFHLRFIQRERKTERPPASISVSWITPGGVEQLIPEENWIPGWQPSQFSIQTILPPDDRSYGFERGIKVDRDWDAAVTAAILEFAQVAAKELWPEYSKKHKKDADQDRQQLKAFLREKLEIAFRSPLSDELANLYIDGQLAKEEDDVEAIKRVLLVGLKSPRFLYPQADLDQTVSARVGSRLALCLLDSLPVDDHLAKTIRAGQLETEEQIRNMAWHLVGDHRAQAKLRGLIYEWLHLSAGKDRKKHEEMFPGFDDLLIQDTRRSLDAFINDFIQSESCDYRVFFNADWGYTTQRMQAFYGEKWAPDQPWTTAAGSSETEVAHPAVQPLMKTASRSGHNGLLTHPYLLSGLAYHDASSPIHRGVFVLRHLLGRQIQPPQDAAFTPLPPDLHPNLSTRERVDLQTSPLDCDSCHSRINSLGFTLENWDAAGRFREVEQGKPIDSSGYYTNRDGQRLELNGFQELAQLVAGSRDAHQAFVRRAFQHYTKQPPGAFGPETLERLTQHFVDHQFNVRSLLVEIAVISSKQDVPQKLVNADVVK